MKVDRNASDANVLERNTCRIFAFSRPLCRHLSEPFEYLPDSSRRRPNRNVISAGMRLLQKPTTLTLTKKSKNTQREKASSASESHIVLLLFLTRMPYFTRHNNYYLAKAIIVR